MRRVPELVSVITPTYGRPQFLRQLWTCIAAQTWNNVEWLVDDDSPTPCEFMRDLDRMEAPRVRYFHNGGIRRTIGQKRNDLIAQAKGDYIVHFDDDDYYAPHYIAHMLTCMMDGDADICKLSSFFLYYKQHKLGAYWDLLVKEGLHFRNAEQALIPIAVSQENNAQLQNIHLGFGFSYVYKRSVWHRHNYRHVDIHEDEDFIRKAASSFRVKLIPDNGGLCLHTIHGVNTSQCFPQSIFPAFMLKLMMPGAALLLSADP